MLGGEIRVGATTGQQSHRRHVVGLRRAPEGGRPLGLDPVVAVAELSEPQLARHPRSHVGAAATQRRHEVEIGRLLLVDGGLGVPAVVPPPHVDRGVERGETVDVGQRRVCATIQQDFGNVHVAVDDGERHRRRLFAGTGEVHIGATLDQRADRRQVALASGKVQRGESSDDGGPVDALVAAIARGLFCHGLFGLRRRQGIAIGVDADLLHLHDLRGDPGVGAVREQDLNRGGAIASGGEHQRGLTIRDILRADIGAAVD